jgi:WD40 repeat protein/serine/threonine protein kinase
MTTSIHSQSPPALSDPVLDDLLDDLADRLQNGHPIDREEILARYPKQAESLRRLLPAMEVMAELGVSASRVAVSSRPTVVSPLDAVLGVLGDFRVIREVGRGGMGVVYEATQISLGRRVALKVLPFAAALDSHQLQRFKTEAQAAAQLHHTNIVPVFWVGCERGVHYYAMQFIEGQTLAGLIQSQQSAASEREAECRSAHGGRGASARHRVRRPDDYRRVATLGIQAAEALDHAHRAGVLHRDVKPANLLIDGHDKLWITDFGVARFVNDSGLTLTGNLVGTLRYMSPEQALARRLIVDQRTDVYSLGATLYELLTLRPAVGGVDRQDVLRRIAEDDPIAPRRIDPAIPRDLETIVLKTLAKEPQARYATAHDLADDLRRFLEHRPIIARRPNMVERAAKWVWRHPTAVASVVSVLVVAVIGLSASLIAVNHERARTAAKAREVEERSNEVRRLSQTLEWELYVSRVNQAQGDYEAGNVERADATLAACPESFRNWEWRHIRRLCHQERYAVRSDDFTGGVYRLPVLFRPDGRTWISGGVSGSASNQGGSLKLWDTASGRCLQNLAAEGLPTIASLAVSPDGRLIAVGLGELGVPTQLRELPGGRLVGELSCPKDWAWPDDMAFSPDGRRLVDCRDRGRLVLWDVDSKKLLRSIEAHPQLAFAVAFHPGGKLVASAAKDGLIHIWDSETGARVRTIKGHEGAVFDLAFAPDGRRLASGGWDQTVRIWDIETGSLSLALPSQAGFVTHLAFLSNGDRLASSSGQSVTLWQVASGRALLTVRGRNQLGAGLDVAPDGSCFLTSTASGTVRLWDAALTAARVLRTIDWVNQVAFSPDQSKVVAADAGGVVHVWDAATGQAIHVMKGHDDSVRSACFTPDGAWVVSASWDGSVEVWDTAAGRVLKNLLPQTHPKYKRLMSWLKPPRGTAINQGSLSPDGSQLATGGWDAMVHIWDLTSGAEVLRYPEHKAVVWGVAYAPDGNKIASVGADRTIRLWDSRTGRDLWTATANLPKGATIQRQFLAFSPDGRLLAVCVGHETNGPYGIELRDVATGSLVRLLENPGSQINAVTFSPDGTRIATAGEDRSVKLWDTESGQNVLVLRGHTASVLAVAFSADGQKLASGSVDATVRIWDAPQVAGRNVASFDVSMRPRRSLNER